MVLIKEASGHKLRSIIRRRDEYAQAQEPTTQADEIPIRLGPLTPPLPEDPELPGQNRRWSFSKPRNRQPISLQTKSPLFKTLPAEVRLIIWGHYLCIRKLHIMRMKWRQGREARSRIVGVQCHEQPGICSCSHRCWGQLARRPAGGCVGTGKGVEAYGYEDEEWKFDARVDFVALLRSCRLIYTETIDMIYRHNTFLFNHADTIIDLPGIILPQRLSLIRTAQLGFADPGGRMWDSCCWVLGNKLPALETLTIHLFPHVVGDMDDLLIPLHQVRQPRKFEVCLIKPWYMKKGWEASASLVDAPFQFELIDNENRPTGSFLVE
ncbi:hypothetical protein N7508_001529 [Penicillium antarcticum]|uniref:uncharacterized protein n=1 Tax=Penicillium antarcticum TaxID=416450 RepID=UPI002383D525|nr:uncharacterized protein N7508_001529 [Penicillium antarcticum]KAJ5317021.1 hypothetical protein N7508_001529 [Penicillium antarcticum]